MPQKPASLTAQYAAIFKPRDFVVNLGGGERLAERVRAWLVPMDGGSLHA